MDITSAKIIDCKGQASVELSDKPMKFFCFLCRNRGTGSGRDEECHFMAKRPTLFVNLEGPRRIETVGCLQKFAGR
ncbi:MAG: hypothetical protein P8Y84_13815, partial [Desulfuromonadales bacterium]